MSDGTTDWEATGLLDGLDDDAREARTALLERLTAAGVSREELETAVREGRLAALPAEIVLGGPARYSAREVAHLTGMPLEQLVALRRANGMPVDDLDARVVGDPDLEIARILVALGEAGVSDEQLESATRVMSRALRQVADVMSEIVLQLAYAPDLDERQLAERLAARTEDLTPFIGPVLETSVRQQLRAATRDAATAQRLDSGLPGARETTVAFADIVGFTRLGEEIAPDELERVTARLGVLVAEVLRPPVRFVKSIGDAAMLVSPEPGPLVDVALDLVDAADAAEDTFPQLRIGVASGLALPRGGDWIGRPVNLASRLTTIARAGSVLTTREVREALSDRYRWSAAGVRKLRGVPEPVAVHRVRRRATPG